ncbi:cupin domain-containing protein [Halogeometricum luteum]|uniref:Cupin domain-containing protein n=1 Tax=Halogeometricum luteum TaxID=2950537 RepID=A0ABU2FYA8_9EURY|nr:cupin domain-containing protein [Halogeometricum sp. S3BR5-2]MDS0293038.1 cupin domain-containing protein [Halogeometricum sp. S3BR5-2]
MVKRVSAPDLPDAPNPTSRKKEVDEAVGASAFGFNVYEVRPGERVPWGYHSHPEHEELFYVVSGEIVVDTEDGPVRAAAGDAIFVEPGEKNRARNDGEEVAEVVAVGAPKDGDGAVIEEECPACGAVTDRTYESVESDGRPVYVLSCAACGTETDRFGAGPEGGDEADA